MQPLKMSQHNYVHMHANMYLYIYVCTKLPQNSDTLQLISFVVDMTLHGLLMSVIVFGWQSQIHTTVAEVLLLLPSVCMHVLIV